VGKLGKLTSVGNVKDAASVLVPIVNVVTTADCDRHRVLTHRLRQRRLILRWHVCESIQGGHLPRVILLVVPVHTWNFILPHPAFFQILTGEGMCAAPSRRQPQVTALHSCICKHLLNVTFPP